jgi:hypothetical protein
VRAAFFLWAAGCGATGAAEPTPLARFLEWFPGEYDNHEQVWQEKLDNAAHPHERIHHIFAPVGVPALGEHVFYVEQYLEGDPARIYRQRLYQIDAIGDDEIRLTIWRLREEARFRNAHRTPAALVTLAATDLVATPGCEVRWRWQPEGHFHGQMGDGTCRYRSGQSGGMIRVQDDLRLTASELWIRDEAFDDAGQRVFGHPEGLHHINRKVSYYSGWGGIKARGPTAARDDDDWHFSREIVMHNEGQRWRVLDSQGKPSGYALELARLTYQNTRTAILKLGLVDEATGETVAYSWANPEASRIGINLRWAQAGLTLREPDARFGFTSDPAPPPAADPPPAAR